MTAVMQGGGTDQAVGLSWSMVVPDLMRAAPSRSSGWLYRGCPPQSEEPPPYSGTSAEC